MKSKYKWPCDICKSFTNEFEMIGERLVCPSCMKKTGGRIELQMPIQTSIFEFLEEDIGGVKKYDVSNYQC